jgi:hypothetical protein
MPQQFSLLIGAAVLASRVAASRADTRPLAPAWWGWSGAGWGYVGPGGGRGWFANGWGWRGAGPYAAPTYVSRFRCGRWDLTAAGWMKVGLC